jgi:A/G-specific adenine glycosylase
MQNPTLFRRQLNSWFKANQRALPWRQNRSPYNTWVSELMLQQTQVTTMVKYFERWIKELPNVEALAAADDEHVMHLWQGLGYYSRARNLKKGAQYIIEHHQGQLPQTIEELMDIPGIGRYTAGAIASLAFNIKAPIVDGNVLRVFSRLYNLDAPINEQKAKDHIYQLQFDLVPNKNPGSFNESLMELGALICTPKNTQCPTCPVQDF